MRSQTPPLAAGALIVTVHIVLNDFGLPGRALCETDELQADEGNRHRKHPRRPIFASPSGARLKNRRRLGASTEDIARVAFDRMRSENRPIGKATQEFLERALGVNASGTTNAIGTDILTKAGPQK